ncbi:MAG: GNAT family N-acetyltransferase [Verrucomicrobiota bacterium]|nr:GNAT family N-acetyltransferase [Verrucomicrobiota bacterium]
MKRKQRPNKASNGIIDIRQMQLNDLPQVFRLGQRLFTAEKLPTLYRSWDEHEILELFQSDEETCLVAEDDGKVVGFALGCMMEKPRSAWRYGWLEWLGVTPRLKRHGIARRLLNQLTQLFIDREARIMLVDTDEDNTDALAFLRKTGFGQETRHVYLSRNLDDHPKSVERKNGHRNGKVH